MLSNPLGRLALDLVSTRRGAWQLPAPPAAPARGSRPSIAPRPRLSPASHRTPGSILSISSPYAAGRPSGRRSTIHREIVSDLSDSRARSSLARAANTILSLPGRFELPRSL